MKGKTVSVSYMLLGILFCVCLISANLLATKQIMWGPFNITAGVIVFPISYIVNDCIAEVWGFNKAKLIIWVGFFMNFLFALFGFVADLIPGAPYWNNQEGFHNLFGLAPRVVSASFLAFLVGSFLNAYIMSVMKVASNGKRFSLRAILSTIVGETADSLIFFPIALGGIVPFENLLLRMCWQILLKTAYEIIILPVTIKVVNYVKRVEGVDVYDKNISYNVLKVSEV